MSSGTSISVVIPAFNAAACVAGAIDSARAQTLAAGEIVVVDDGSSDETAAIVAHYPEPVRCLRQKNRGLPAARNAGIGATRGEWVALLDADDRWPERHLEESLRLAEQCGARLVFSDARVVAPDRRWDSWFEKSGHHWLRGRAAGTVEDLQHLLLEHGSFILPSSVLVRRDALTAVGGFDESLNPGPEDLDLWLRIAPRLRCTLNRATCIVRTEAASSLSANNLGMALGARKLWSKVLASTPKANNPAVRWQRHIVRSRLANAEAEIVFWALQSGRADLARKAAWQNLRLRFRWQALLSCLYCTLPVPLAAAAKRARHLGRYGGRHA